MVFRSGYC